MREDISVLLSHQGHDNLFQQPQETKWPFVTWSLPTCHISPSLTLPQPPGDLLSNPAASSSLMAFALTKFFPQTFLRQVPTYESGLRKNGTFSERSSLTTLSNNCLLVIFVTSALFYFRHSICHYLKFFFFFFWRVYYMSPHKKALSGVFPAVSPGPYIQ